MKILKRVFNCEVKGVDEKEGTLTAYVSTNAVDRMKEILDPKGADLSQYKKNPIVLWAHDYSKPPIGKSLWIKKDGNGILSKVKFAPTEFGQEIFNLYKDGFMKAFSVGFIPKKTECPEDEKGSKKDKARRVYKEWELLEYSAVPVPANPEALALAVQKGVVSQDFVEQLGAYDEGDIEDPEIDSDNDDHLEKSEDKLEDYDNCLSDLIAENTLLKEANLAINKEFLELQYKFYSTLESIKEATKPPEITGEDIKKQIEDGISGAIRRLQGKVD